MEMNGPDKSFSRHQEKSLLRNAAQIARSAFDSPRRAGCPGAETLKLLAQRSSSIADSPDLIDHIATCSPCFVEYSQYRTAHKRRLIVWSSLASAAILVIFFLFVRVRMLPSNLSSAPQNEITREAKPLDRTLDLRLSGVPRGDTHEPLAKQLPRLPRGDLALSIYLPTGSESGIYEIALVNASRHRVLTASAEATLQNYIEVLPARFDLKMIPAGRYELLIRRSEAPQWNSYLVEIE
jgi:hypothetical protein